MNGADYSGVDWRWALRLANRSFTVEQISRVIAAKPTGRRDPGSIKYMAILEQRGKDAADRYATRTAERAVEWVKDNPPIRGPQEATVRLLEIEAAASALPWFVYGGPGVRRALEAALVVGDRIRRVAISLSWREWAELAGQDFEVVRSHGKALTSLGWMVRNPQDRLGRTSRYAIRTPAHIHLHTGGWNVGLSADRTWLAHDALRPDGLGDAAWYLLASLPAPAELPDLARRVGLDVESLTEHLLRLERFGLVILDDSDVRRASDDLVPLLNVAASEVGTVDRLRFDKWKHEGDRVAFRGHDVNVGVPS